jgi:hypothetical protein
MDPPPPSNEINGDAEDERPPSITRSPDPPVARGIEDGRLAAYQVESYVTWCGHAQEVIPGPR